MVGISSAGGLPFVATNCRTTLPLLEEVLDLLSPIHFCGDLPQNYKACSDLTFYRQHKLF